MKGEVKFFICKHCGNIIEMVHDAGVKVVCCGEPMAELKANTVDAAAEKHVPVVKVDGNTIDVCVGSVEHPMSKEHSIEWVCVASEQGCQRKYLCSDEAPKTKFALTDGDKAITVYAYCNLHGLWKTEVK